MIENIIPDPIDDYTTNDYVSDTFRYLVVTTGMIMGLIGISLLVWAV
ncbi:MAG: hypothetical protein PHF76_11960 [Bacteroidales bacterium]|nr:hypothetical protein [Bacteroidales bacterium]